MNNIVFVGSSDNQRNFLEMTLQTKCWLDLRFPYEDVVSARKNDPAHSIQAVAHGTEMFLDMFNSSGCIWQNVHSFCDEFVGQVTKGRKCLQIMTFAFDRVRANIKPEINLQTKIWAHILVYPIYKIILILFLLNDLHWICVQGQSEISTRILWPIICENIKSTCHVHHNPDNSENTFICPSICFQGMCCIECLGNLGVDLDAIDINRGLVVPWPIGLGTGNGEPGSLKKIEGQGSDWPAWQHFDNMRCLHLQWKNKLHMIAISLWIIF